MVAASHVQFYCKKFEIEYAAGKPAGVIVSEGVSEGVHDQFSPEGVAVKSTIIDDVDFEGAKVTSSAAISDEPFNESLDQILHESTVTELSLYLLIACLLRPLLHLTLCAWKPSSLTAVVTSIKYSVCSSNARVGVDSMPVHSSRPQALSIAKLPMLALFTSLPWISTCEGAFGKDMAREGANETDACKPTSIFIRLAISIAFYWYSFMRYHGSKLGFRTIVREYQGPGYRTTQLRWDGINQNYSEQIKCFVKLIALSKSSEVEKIRDRAALAYTIPIPSISIDRLFCNEFRWH